MWPFRERSIAKRIARARTLIELSDYLGAREEVGGVEDPVAAELFQLATQRQIERVLQEVTAQYSLGDSARAREFLDIARRLGATEVQLASIERGPTLRPARPRP